MIKTVAIALAVVPALTVAPAIAQTDREIALEAIAQAMSELEEIYPEHGTAFSSADSIQRRIDQATEIINQLQSHLQNNGYARISGFSLGVPWGVALNIDLVD